ncbi:MAG: MATE family efflux transporter [Prevotella sp.]|nr:MATE family efflux transporter [Prevotella sp.]
MAYSFRIYSPHYRSLVKLGVPIVMGQIGNIVLGFADTLMIGHHSLNELAAASFVGSMFTLLIIIDLGFSFGLTPVVGSMYGRDEIEQTGGMLRNSIATNTVVAVILVAVAVIFYFNIHRMGQPKELLPIMKDYLLVNIFSLPFLCWFNSFKQFFDGITDTKISMIVIIACNLFNIFGNWVLIYGNLGMPELGLLGAGISTLIARVLMFLGIFAIFLVPNRYRRYRKGYFAGRVNRNDFRKLNVLGVPLAMQLGMETSAFMLSTVFVGWIGITALASHQIMLTISQVLYMIPCGMAAAIAIRVSYFYGRNEITNVHRAVNSGFHVIMVIAVVLSITVLSLRHNLGYWFTDSNEVSRLVAQLTIVVVVYQFGDGLQYTFANALRGISCVKPMIWIAFLSYFIISLPLGYFLGIYLGIGVVGVWCAFPVCLLCAGVLYYIYFMKNVNVRR